jgi:hypothetical protein
MATRRLISAVGELSRSLKEARKIIADAQKWSVPQQIGGRPQITPRRRDLLVELAFLRAVSGWEIFLEESFLLYLLGHQPPRGRSPRRYGFPPDRAAAHEWCADGKDYAKWSPAEVKKRANRWFKDGKPFTPALQGQQSRLDQLITIRNAIAHDSASAKSKFENIVRNELQTLPPGTTVGNFLLTTKPGATPPTSFIEFYLEQLEHVALDIVPK